MRQVFIITMLSIVGLVGCNDDNDPPVTETPVTDEQIAEGCRTQGCTLDTNITVPEITIGSNGVELADGGSITL